MNLFIFQTISYRNIFFVRNIFPVGFELSPYVWGNERESGRQTDRERTREAEGRDRQNGGQ